jgi:hypothetical protein
MKGDKTGITPRAGLVAVLDFVWDLPFFGRREEKKCLLLAQGLLAPRV